MKGQIMANNRKIYDIKCGPFKASVAPAHGANTVRFTYKNNPVFVSPKNADDEKNMFVGSPVMIPANRTKGGIFEFEGHRYSLPLNDPGKINNLNGGLWEARFDVVCADKSFIICKFENREGEVYPFDFDFTTEIKLTSEGLFQKFTLANMSNEKMPYTFGLHTTFTVPEKFSVPIAKLVNRQDFIPDGTCSELDARAKLILQGNLAPTSPVTSFFTSSGNTASVGKFKFTVSENFDHWLIFNGGGGAGFLCVQPISGNVNGLNMPDGHKILEPWQSVDNTAKIMLT